MACGTASGHLVLYDVYTRAISLSMCPHSAPIVQLMWSSYTHKHKSANLRDDDIEMETGLKPSRGRGSVTSLLVCTASSDWSVAVSDLRLRQSAHMDFNSAVLNAEFIDNPLSPQHQSSDKHNNDDNAILLLCSLSADWPVLIRFDAEKFQMDRVESACAAFQRDPALSGSTGYCCPQLHMACFATLQGDIHIYSLNGKNNNDEEYNVPRLDQVVKVSAASILSVSFSPNSTMMLVNSTDRALRLYRIQNIDSSKLNNNQDQDGNGECAFEITLLQKYQDSIDRIQWGPSSFSPTSDHFIATSPHHSLYIFNCTPPSYTLHKILDGPKSSPACLDACYHPRFPGTLLTLCSASGGVFVWMRSGVDEYWSGYAPGFRELENNVEYREREDEFDSVQDNHPSYDIQDDEGINNPVSKKRSTSYSVRRASGNSNNSGSLNTGSNGGGEEEDEIDVETYAEEEVDPGIFGIPLIIEDVILNQDDDNTDDDDDDDEGGNDE